MGIKSVLKSGVSAATKKATTAGDLVRGRQELVRQKREVLKSVGQQVRERKEAEEAAEAAEKAKKAALEAAEKAGLTIG